MLPLQSWSLINLIHLFPSTMRSVIICLLSLLLLPALGVQAGNQGLPSLSSHPPSALNPPSARLPSINQPAAHEPRIHLAPIKPPSTRLSSTPLPSIHQLPLHQPSTHHPSILPPTYPPPPHGQLVGFQGNTRPHTGIILGSQPDQHGKFKVAPVKLWGHDAAQRPVLVAFHDPVVKVHRNDMVGTTMRASETASELMRHHAQNPPVERHPIAPVYGSRNYVTLHGSGRRLRRL